MNSIGYNFFLIFFIGHFVAMAILLLSEAHSSGEKNVNQIINFSYSFHVVKNDI